MADRLMKWCIVLMTGGLLAVATGMAQDLDDGSILVAQDLEVDAALNGDVADAEANIIGELELDEPVLEAAPVEPELADLDVGEIDAGGSDVADLAAEALGGDLSLEELTLDEPAVEPLTEIPALDDLDLEEPAVEAPVLDDLDLEEPAVEEPGLEGLAMEEPALDDLALEEPAVEVPALDDLVLEEPMLEDLALEEPMLEGLELEEPMLEGLELEEPMLEGLGLEGLGLEEPMLEGLGFEEPAALPMAEPIAPEPALAEPIAPEPAGALEGLISELAPAGPVVVEDDLDAAINAAVKEAIEEGVPEIPPTDPKVRKILDMMGREQQMRAAYEEHARGLLVEGERALLTRDYPHSITRFDEALKNYELAGNRPQTLTERERARMGLARSLYQRALILRGLREKSGIETARMMAERAATLGHERAAALVAELDDWITNGPPDLTPPEPTRIIDTAENKKREEEIRLLLSRGRQYFAVGRFEESQESFERVLKRDPQNTEAIRWRNKISHIRQDRATQEAESTRTDMMAMVRETWNPRNYGLRELETETMIPKAITRTADARRKILNKMENIEIPEINFRLANIHDVLAVLVEESQLNDKIAKPGEKLGVDIVLSLGDSMENPAPEDSTAPPDADPFADTAAPGDDFGFGDAVDDGGGGGGGGIGGVPLITFRARRISLLEVLKLVTKVANLKYRVEGSVVMIVRKDAPEGDIITRMYNVLPNVGERIETTRAETGVGGGGGDFIGMGEGGVSGGQYADWKKFFLEVGVPWPAGSSIKHLPSLGKIVVANTADNLTIFEQVLNQLNVVPFQIEIEARFVEVQETDLDSLGFQWLLTDDWEIAQQQGSAVLPMSSRPRIMMNANPVNGGFSSGQRFLNSPGGSGVGGLTTAIRDDIMSISSILTNPELTFVLHALQQTGHADVLSAPKVTAQAGIEATIKVVTEYIYPTDFTVQPIMGRDTTGQSTIVGGIVEPSSFETREVGVILSVLPEVSPEGQMINLTMTPEVVTEPTWKNYGSEYSRTLPDGTIESQQMPMEQPFFHTRSVSTSISIYNGATVVMGGMITEQRTDVDDSIPILSAIPIIGRLFSSKIERSEKRNLLIFVTAKLVDPAGKHLDSESLQDKFKTRPPSFEAE